jgi:hypothetical protein
MRIPLLSLDTVYHIGTLDGRSPRGRAGADSLEGHCLSVSLCPVGWRGIARLGGLPLFGLKKTGGRFLDLLAALEDLDVRGPAIQYARQAGWVVDREAWRAYTYDPEQEEWRYFTCATEPEAREEADGDGAPDDGGPTVRRTTILAATPALERLLDIRLRLIDASDYALLAWAETVFPAAGIPLDGVWWLERYDPLALSAPRGGIFPAQVPSWHADPLDWAAVLDDEDLLASTPDPGPLTVTLP